jgi:hypothetical protein
MSLGRRRSSSPSESGTIGASLLSSLEDRLTEVHRNRKRLLIEMQKRYAYDRLFDKLANANTMEDIRRRRKLMNELKCVINPLHCLAS